MNVGSDISLQTLDSCRTAGTLGTIASIGVAVPVRPPVVQSPVEVYSGRSLSVEDGISGPFVIGDGEEI
jgi:hypothetical protein